MAKGLEHGRGRERKGGKEENGKGGKGHAEMAALMAGPTAKADALANRKFELRCKLWAHFGVDVGIV